MLRDCEARWNCWSASFRAPHSDDNSPEQADPLRVYVQARFQSSAETAHQMTSAWTLVASLERALYWIWTSGIVFNWLRWARVHQLWASGMAEDSRSLMRVCVDWPEGHKCGEGQGKVCVQKADCCMGVYSMGWNLLSLQNAPDNHWWMSYGQHSLMCSWIHICIIIWKYRFSRIMLSYITWEVYNRLTLMAHCTSLGSTGVCNFIPHPWLLFRKRGTTFPTHSNFDQLH